MRLDQHANTHPRLLRKAALEDETAGKSKPRTRKLTALKNAKATKTAKSAESATNTRARPSSETRLRSSKPSTPSSGASRFLGATHLDEHQKERIRGALETRRIGDEMGRQIFVGALEYQLSAFAHELQRRGRPAPKPDHGRDAAVVETLVALADRARLLRGLMNNLPDASRESLTRTLATQDQLGRDYDERYLRELGCEIGRLERACSQTSASDSEPPVPAEDPKTSRAFVAKLAEVYAECFEAEPTAEASGQFIATLAVLEELTGYVIGHDTEFLADILESGQLR